MCGAALTSCDEAVGRVGPGPSIATDAFDIAAAIAIEVSPAPVTSCRANVTTRKVFDPGDIGQRMPGAEKVVTSIDLSPLRFSALEQAVARAVVGPRFHPVSNVLTLNMEQHGSADDNMGEIYLQVSTA